MPRIAVLRFENLCADRSFDWMGDGFASILRGELRGSPELYAVPWRTLDGFDALLGRHPDAPGVSTETGDALAAGANHAVYGYFFVASGVLRATAEDEDLASRHIVRVITASGPVSGGIFSVADRLARQLGPPHPYGTDNEAALRDLVSGSASTDPAAAASGFAKAAAADPNFGSPYVFALNAALAARDRAAADAIISQARAHETHFSAMDRGEIDLAAAILRGDFAGQLAALRGLTNADPANPDHHRALADALMSRRDYENAIVEFRRALTIRPEDPAALNAMGYAAAFRGDLPTAIRVLRGYEQMRPYDANPLDSLGDVHFALGHFAEAEQFYLAAYKKDPGFLHGGELLNAAQARLMTGDISGATAIFKRYDSSSDFAAAAWNWQTGARTAAVAEMERLKGADADAQAALWLLESGDRRGAAEYARKAMAEAGGAPSPQVALAANLAAPESFPAPSPAIRDFARAYTFLLNGDFTSAAPALRDLYQRPTANPDDGLAVLLAWAYEEIHDWAHAEPLLRLTPLREAASLPMFGSLYFPRLFELRAAVLERHGNRAEAARYRQLFGKLSGH